MSVKHKHYRTRWIKHRNNAKWRGIRFLLSFEDWLEIWTKSGHLDDSGRQRHQYCMARVGDKGAYEVGNVFITTQLENNSVKKPFVSRGNRRRVWTDEMRANNSAGQKRVGNKPPSWEGKHHKRSTKRKIGEGVHAFRVVNPPSLAQRQNPPPSWLGKKHSPETIKKMKASARARLKQLELANA